MSSPEKFALAAAILACCAYAVLLIARAREVRAALRNRTASLDLATDALSHERVTGGPNIDPLDGSDLDAPFKRAAENVRRHPPRETFHPHVRPGFQMDRNAAVKAAEAAAADASLRSLRLTLSQRHLSHINAKRRAAGQPTLNRRGFLSAIAAAPDRESMTQSDWLSYLILYECLFNTEHGQTPNDDLHIDYTPPVEGQGGTFSGAGATSSWDTPPTDEPQRSVSDDPAPSFSDPAPSDPSPSYDPPAADPAPDYTSNDTGSGGDTGGGDPG